MNLDVQTLRFRRQFLISKSPISSLDSWKRFEIGRYSLQAHPDLEINGISIPEKTIVLIGEMIDPSEPEKRNPDILNDIFENASCKDSLFLWIKRYAGRYALFYLDDKDTIILNDALALREIYYCTKDNQIICASQPSLVVKFAKPEIKPRSDPEFLDYFTKHSKNSKWNPYYKWIGDETYFMGIKHLLPNHYFDIKKCEVRRYWPNEAIKRLDFEDALSKSCSFLQGGIKALAKRHALMLAVTAGTDSRTLLAATKGIQDRIYYFVNDEELGARHPDVLIPKKMFESIGVPFHIHDVPKEVDENFREIFLNNTFFASERILPTIYNIYYKGHPEKVNILGIGEIGRTRFGKEPKNLDSYRISYKMRHKKDRYALRQSERILAELLPVGRRFNLNVLTLLYWEHWLGNWGTIGNSESDIAIEEINPCDSHKLYEILLGIDNNYTKYHNPIIFKEMIRRMWPELMKWPINPPYSKGDKIAQSLKNIGIYPLMQEMKYRVNYMRYRH